MRKTILKMNLFIIAVGLLLPTTLLAQKEDKEKKEVRQVIITSKGDKDEKVVIEIKGDIVTVNGKPVGDYKEGDLKVKVNKVKDMESLYFRNAPGMSLWNYDTKGNKGDKGAKDFDLFSMNSNLAMLGVSTQKTENGTEVKSVTKESAAEKAGLKEKDIITKINDTKIGEPDDLSAAIKKHKPGDKVTVTYLRDKKEKKVTAELTKWKGINAFALSDGQGFNFEIEDLKNSMTDMNRLRGMRTAPFGNNWMWSGGSPKLGLSVQDTDDGKGVNVIEVDEESNAAKAGIKEDDVITEVDGKAINNTDDMVKMVKENKDKSSIMIKLNRSGKTMNIEVKVPKKLKTADL